MAREWLCCLINIITRWALSTGVVAVQSTLSTTSVSCCVDHWMDIEWISSPWQTAVVCQMTKNPDLTADCFQIWVKLAAGCFLARRHVWLYCVLCNLVFKCLILVMLSRPLLTVSGSCIFTYTHMLAASIFKLVVCSNTVLFDSQVSRCFKDKKIYCWPWSSSWGWISRLNFWNALAGWLIIVVTFKTLILFHFGNVWLLVHCMNV